MVGEIQYDQLIAGFPPAPTLSDLPRFPAIDRDLSVIVDETVNWGQILQTIEQVDPALVLIEPELPQPSRTCECVEHSHREFSTALRVPVLHRVRS